MANDTTAEIDEKVRVLAEVRGLGRALALAPDSVVGAIERGRRIGSFPQNYTQVTEPAVRFAAASGDDA